MFTCCKSNQKLFRQRHQSVFLSEFVVNSLLNNFKNVVLILQAKMSRFKLNIYYLKLIYYIINLNKRTKVFIIISCMYSVSCLNIRAVFNQGNRLKIALNILAIVKAAARISLSLTLSQKF